MQSKARNSCVLPLEFSHSLWLYESVFTPSELSTVARLLQPTTILTFNSGNTNVTSAALHPKVRLNGEAFDQLSDSGK